MTKSNNPIKKNKLEKMEREKMIIDVTKQIASVDQNYKTFIVGVLTGIQLKKISKKKEV